MQILDNNEECQSHIILLRAIQFQHDVLFYYTDFSFL
jgi:hypothetical protein